MQCHKNVTGSDLCKLPEHGTQKERPLKGDKTLKASNKICVVSNAISILSIDVKKRKTTDYYSEILMMTLRDEEASNVKIKGLISQS